jgi:hypothetical protein
MVHSRTSSVSAASLGALRTTSSLSSAAGSTSSLSAEAVKLLSLGRTDIGYVHERRRSAGASPADQHSGGDSGHHTTFIESLGLTPKTLESLTRGDFVYCVRRGSADDLDTNSYELRVVNHKDISPADYFTVSQTGVTHVRKSFETYVSVHPHARSSVYPRSLSVPTLTLLACPSSSVSIACFSRSAASPTLQGTERGRCLCSGRTTSGAPSVRPLLST